MLQLVGSNIIHKLKEKVKDLLIRYYKFGDKESDKSGHEEDIDKQILKRTLEQMRGKSKNILYGLIWFDSIFWL